jgi:hypothetical protein
VSTIASFAVSELFYFGGQMLFHVAHLGLMATRALHCATARLASAVFALLLTTSVTYAQVPGSLDTTPFPGFASGNGLIVPLGVGTEGGKVPATTDTLICTRVMLCMTISALHGNFTFPANAARDQCGTNTSRDLRKYLIAQRGMSLL